MVLLDGCYCFMLLYVDRLIGCCKAISRWLPCNIRPLLQCCQAVIILFQVVARVLLCGYYGSLLFAMVLEVIVKVLLDYFYGTHRAGC